MFTIAIFILIGQVLVMSLLMEPMQQGVLQCMICCCRRDKPLVPIISRRLKSEMGTNLKISVMIVTSIAYLALHTSSQVTAFNYFSNTFLFLVSSDIIFDTRLYVPFKTSTVFLDEIPISDYLDSYMVDDEETGRQAIVESYTFYTCPF